jgi:hypothetical protein
MPQHFWGKGARASEVGAEATFLLMRRPRGAMTRGGPLASIFELGCSRRWTSASRCPPRYCAEEPSASGRRLPRRSFALRLGSMKTLELPSSEAPSPRENAYGRCRCGEARNQAWRGCGQAGLHTLRKGAYSKCGTLERPFSEKGTGRSVPLPAWRRCQDRRLARLGRSNWGGVFTRSRLLFLLPNEDKCRPQCDARSSVICKRNNELWRCARHVEYLSREHCWSWHRHDLVQSRTSVEHSEHIPGAFTEALGDAPSTALVDARYSRTSIDD